MRRLPARAGRGERETGLRPMLTALWQKRSKVRCTMRGRNDMCMSLNASDATLLDTQCTQRTHARTRTLMDTSPILSLPHAYTHSTRCSGDARRRWAGQGRPRASTRHACACYPLCTRSHRRRACAARHRWAACRSRPFHGAQAGRRQTSARLPL